MTFHQIELELIELFESSYFEQAITLLEMYPDLIVSPTTQTASYISTLLIMCKEFEECIYFSRKHLDTCTSPDLFYNLAFSLEKSNQISESITYYQCARLYTFDTELRAEINKKLIELRYHYLSDELKNIILEYNNQVKEFIKTQIENPDVDISIDKFITFDFPIVNEKIRILYGTMEIANHISHYVKYFRSINYETFGINYYPSYLKYQCDFSFNLTQISPDRFNEHYLLNAIDLIPEYDVFHFLFNTTLIPGSIDLVIYKKLNKKVFMHNLGSDVRNPAIAKKLHNYWDYANIYLESLNQHQNEQNLKVLSSWIDDCIVNDYEMYAYVDQYYKNIHMLGLPIDLNYFSYNPPVDNKQIHIVHAPTNKAVKGSVYFENAITVLSKIHNIKYTRIENMDHKSAIEIYKNADIVLDQLIIGTYGTLALECMALGTPVASFINSSLKTPHHENIPIWNVNIDNLVPKLEELILNFNLRKELSENGRKYVEKYNALNKIGENLLNLYVKK